MIETVTEEKINQYTQLDTGMHHKLNEISRIKEFAEIYLLKL